MISNLIPYAIFYNIEPTAYIVVGDTIPKIYFGNKLYFNSNQEFKIELYNPKTINVLAKIYINCKNISAIAIKLKPGQHIYLRRKFNFTEDIRIEFYDEKIPISSSTIGIFNYENNTQNSTSDITYITLDEKVKLNKELVVDNFYNHATTIIKYQILPEFEFNKSKQYCPRCHYHIKKISWESCPNCNNKL